MNRPRSEILALIELAALFLPAIPAYLWLWPNVSGTVFFYPVQLLVYLYVFAGALLIGLRRWSWYQLGINRRGIGFSLVCGMAILALRPLAYLALGWPLTLREFDFWRVAGEVVFYFAFVGVVEELVFRGLMYRALESLRGNGLAIVGSSLGFALWHIGWMGALIVIPFVLGVVFGLIRWRAGGIVGLIVVHGLFDVCAVEMLTPPEMASITDILHQGIVNRAALYAGDILFFGLILFLLFWKRKGRLPY